MIELLRSLVKNAIQLKVECEKTAIFIGQSKIGGKPHVPSNFIWPYFDGENYGIEKANRPLAFLAQINMSDVAALDETNLLPKEGILSFFYELDTMCWGYDIKEKDSFRVYYFKEPITELIMKDFPEDLKEENRLIELDVSFQQVRSYPSIEELLSREYLTYGEDKTWENYEQAMLQFNEVTRDSYGTFHQLLGFSNVVQNSVELEIETVQFYGTMNVDYRIIEKDLEKIKALAEQSNWIQLFQIGTIESENEHVMFGDCGQLYFYMKKEDLEQLNFDKCWMILQCS